MSSSLIERELGRLSEGLSNAKEDRAELARIVSKLDEGVDAMRQALNGLNTTTQSMANQILSIATEKCGERLDTIERDRAREAAELKIRLEKFDAVVAQSGENARTLIMYKNVIGTGMSLVVRIGLALLGSAFGGAAITAVVGKFWHHCC